MSTALAPTLFRHVFRFSLSAIFLLSVLLVTGCSLNTGLLKADLGQQTTVKVGQTLEVNNEPLKIKFSEVISDSRCPTGAQCIWQGEVSVRLEITFQNTKYTKVITQPGLTSDTSDAEFDGYSIKLNVLPYPAVGKKIESADYQLQTTVNKSEKLTGGILVTFDVVGEKYSIFMTNKKTIEDIFSVQNGQSQATIPNGKLVRGKVPYNAPWNWHIDSEDIQMAEMTIELSDGTPSQVENDLDYWINTVTRFSPWSAKIVKIQDFR
jgi:hypothetical protein